MQDVPEPGPRQQPDPHMPESAPRRQHQPSHHRSSRRAGPSRPFPPVAQLQRALRRLKFRNAGLRIGGSKTVHGLRWAETSEGALRVATACNTGHDRSDNSEDLKPEVSDPVNCDKCSGAKALAQGQRYDPNRNTNQPPLPAMHRHPIWPGDYGDRTRPLW
ncbi:hypothetical protein GCM10027174_34200 [Salinifilum aidingensis]